MKNDISYHIVMVIIGQYLNKERHPSITPRILQNEMLNDNDFGYRVPFSICEESLELLELAGFIRKNGKEIIAGTSYSAYVKC